MIKFRCKNCNRRISVPEIHAGKTGKCPKCKSVVIVPLMDSSTAVSDSDGAQEYKLAEAQSSEDSLSHANYGLEQQIGSVLSAQEAEPAGQRKLPWVLDIFLYPFSKPALTVLGIIIIIPLLINILVGLAGPFGLFFIIPGFVVNIVLFLYLFWYYCECVRDSAGGGLRAPETVGNTPGVGDMLSDLIKTLGCAAFFTAPLVFYWGYTKKTDAVFYLLAGYGLVFFPMGLLSVIMFDSLAGLNPVLLIGSIFSSFFQYCGLLILFLAITVLMCLAGSTMPKTWFFVSLIRLVGIYFVMIACHLLGRFYWRYKEKLNWEV